MAVEDYAIDGKLDTFSQLNVARKLNPAIAIMATMADPDNADKPKSLMVVAMLSYLVDEDSDYVIKKCLSLVKYKNADGQLFKVVTPNGALAKGDMTMEDMTELTAKVILENLGDFLNTALARLIQ